MRRGITATRDGLTQRLPARAGRRGFVLLLVLALLTVACLISVGVARRSMVVALESAQAVEELQDRWARVSLQRSVLLRADEVLVRAASRAVNETQPRHVADLTLSLNGHEYSLRVADEEAKANLNTVYYTQGQTSVSRFLRGMQAGRDGAGMSRTGRDGIATYGASLPIKLRPYAVKDAAERLPVFDSWGQVFDLAALPDGTTAPAKLMAGTMNVSCWGSGRLNVARAPTGVMQQAVRDMDQDGLLERILESRESRGSEYITEQVRAAGRQRQTEALAELLTTRSGCFSLWIRMTDEARQRYELHVAEPGENARRTSISSFLW